MTAGKVVKVNLNVTVRVQLTAEGKAHCAARPHSYAVIEDRDGYSSWQLWELFNVFGPLLYMGTYRIPFKGLNIEFSTRDVEATDA